MKTQSHTQELKAAARALLKSLSANTNENWELNEILAPHTERLYQALKGK